MPSTLTGHRYLTLLATQGITSGELETELSGSTARKGDFQRLLLNSLHRKNLLGFGYSTIKASATALALVWTRGLFFKGELNVLTFATETAYLLKPPTYDRGTGTGLSAPKFGMGYMCAWDNAVGTIDRFAFYTNTYAALTAIMGPTGNSGIGADSAAGCSTDDNGYQLGGETGSTVYRNEIVRFGYVAEVSAILSAVLSVARRYCAGVSKDTHGYVVGGYTGSMSSEVDGIVFASEAAYNPSVTLSTARARHGAAESSLKGYFAGGETTLNSVEIASIEALTFSSETMATLAAVLDTNHGQMAGMRGVSKAYFAGDNSTVIRALTFATDAAASLSAALPDPANFIGCNSSIVGGGF